MKQVPKQIKHTHCTLSRAINQINWVFSWPMDSMRDLKPKYSGCNSNLLKAAFHTHWLDAKGKSLNCCKGILVFQTHQQFMPRDVGPGTRGDTEDLPQSLGWGLPRAPSKVEKLGGELSEGCNPCTHRYLSGFSKFNMDTSKTRFSWALHHVNVKNALQNTSPCKRGTQGCFNQGTQK